jgi:hypothetical protein
MKRAYIVYLAPLFAATACLASAMTRRRPLPGGHPAGGILTLSGLQGTAAARR